MSSAPNGTLRLGFRTLKGRERCYSMLVSLASFSFKGVVVKGNDWLMKKKMGRNAFIWEAWQPYKMHVYWIRGSANKANVIKRLTGRYLCLILHQKQILRQDFEQASGDVITVECLPGLCKEDRRKFSHPLLLSSGWELSWGAPLQCFLAAPADCRFPAPGKDWRQKVSRCPGRGLGRHC